MRRVRAALSASFSGAAISKRSFQRVSKIATMYGFTREVQPTRLRHAALVSVRPTDRSPPSVGQPCGPIFWVRR